MFICVLAGRRDVWEIWGRSRESSHPDQVRKFSFISTIIGPFSVTGPDPGSGAFFTPGSGMSFFRIPDLGSKIHISESLVTIFWGHKWQTLCQLTQIFFFTCAFSKIKQFTILWNLCLPKKEGQKNFPPALFLSFWIRDPRSDIRGPASGMEENPDPDKHLGSATLGFLPRLLASSRKYDIGSVNRNIHCSVWLCVCGSGSALSWLSWRWIGIANADPDPGAKKFTNINK